MIKELLGRFGYRKLPPRRRRTFTAGVVNRLTADWNIYDTLIDADIYSAMPVIRARARDLCQNNDYARKYLLLCRMNIAGPTGFRFEPNVKEGGKPDKVANLKIAEAWADWSKREHCTVTGRLSFRQVQHLLVKSLARDGEYLVRKVRGPQFKYGYALQILEPDLLPIRLNAVLPNGNRIIMGVEVDSWRKPVAYYLASEREGASGVISSDYRQYERVPASEIYHDFDTDRAFQTRGVTWLASGIVSLKMLSAYEEAVLVKVRAAATTGGWFESKEGNEFEGDDKDAQGNDIISLEPGEWKRLPTGIVPHDVDPTYPTGLHTEYLKGNIRRTANGFGVAYSSLGNDLTDVNYSSIRAGLIDERDNWKGYQADVADGFLVPCYRDWLEMALLTENLNLPAVKFEKFNQPVFTGRRWAWVDPENDINAEVSQIENGLKTRGMTLAERGETVEEIFKELADEKKLAEEYGLTFGKEEKTTGAKNDEGNQSKNSKGDSGREAFPDVRPHSGNGKHGGEDDLAGVLLRGTR